MRAAMLRTTALLALLGLIAVPAGAAEPKTIHIAESGTATEVAVPSSPSGLPCAAEDSILYRAGAQLTGGEFSNLSSDLALSMDFLPAGTSASLLPEDSHVTLSNERGSALLRLAAGTCDNPTLSFDGTTFSGTGTWAVEEASGAYRDMTGVGTFTFVAAIAGARVWSFQLEGSLSVLQPNVAASVVEATWGGQRDADARGRMATVTYRLVNQGPGDAFGLSIVDVDAADGIEPIDFEPIAIGALLSGEATELTVRWSIGKSPDGGSAVRGNEFDTTLDVPHTDALDVAIAADQLVHVIVPPQDH